MGENVQELQGRVRVTVIDVGKGDCILVQTGPFSGLIDTGYEATSGKVLSFLQSQGIDHLGFLVITHYDRDHVGGLRGVAEAVDVDALYLPGYEGTDKNYRGAMKAVADLALPARRVIEEQVLRFGGTTFTILPTSLSYIPDAKGDEGNDDDLSLVATLTFGEDSYLFAGDLEKEGIAAYLMRSFGRFDVLKVPDHGKKCPNADDFLAQVQPKVAIVTDGAKDPADKKALKLLKEAGADVYRSSVHGTVVIESTGAGAYEVACR